MIFRSQEYRIYRITLWPIRSATGDKDSITSLWNCKVHGKVRAWIQDRWSSSNGNGEQKLFRGKSGTLGTLGTLNSGQTFLLWVRFSMTHYLITSVTSVTSEWERFRSCLEFGIALFFDISTVVACWSLRRYVIEWQSIIHHIYPIGVSQFDAYLIISWFIRTLQLPFLLGHSGWEFHPDSGHFSPPGGSPENRWTVVALSNVRNYAAWQEPLGWSCQGQDMVCCSIGMVIHLLIMIYTYY